MIITEFSLKIQGQFKDKLQFFRIPGVFKDQGHFQGLFKVCANPVIITELPFCCNDLFLSMLPTVGMSVSRHTMKSLSKLHTQIRLPELQISRDIWDNSEIFFLISLGKRML